MTVPRMGYDCADFAPHPALVDEGPGVEVQVLDPGEGFEPWKACKIMMIVQTTSLIESLRQFFERRPEALICV